MKLKIIIFVSFVIVLTILLYQRSFAPRPHIQAPAYVDPVAEEASAPPAVWKKISHGISETEVTRIAIAPDDANALLVSTPRAVYRSHGISGYLASLYLEGNKRAVNDIYTDFIQKVAFIATDKGLFQSRDAGVSWQRIYACERSREEECLSVAMFETEIFLGTTRGLFVLSKDESRWKIFHSVFQDKPIVHIAKDGQHLYISTDREVFRIEPLGGDVREIFSVLSREKEESDDEETTGLARSIYGIAVASSRGLSRIWIASSRGIFVSSDFGRSWQSIPRDSIPIGEITSLTACRDDLFISSSKGAYRFHNGQWQDLRAGAETQRFSQIICDPSDRIYAATDRGVFMLAFDQQPLALAGEDVLEIRKRIDQEPSIQSVHRMAIEYAEVHPQKIQQWRSQLVKRALLPKLSISVDGDKNKTISDSVYGSYTSGGQSYIGPDDKTFYNNFGWGVSVSWDLGDLVWNSSQTSIDTRSKLMVELREDILNEVTRLYFERRRLLVQSVQPAAGESSLVELEMRVDELTALIDALTGGGFSREIERGSKDDGA
ncbi:MAG TPA: hypothetical protein PLO93_04640 [Candidatus Omnitrophota bacterium]|nr:hypothetical protein [Candidatus Omnitrophota bacterium]HQL41566.1 hypothetical protein [Candidatus Omnitrophota bacterium]